MPTFEVASVRRSRPEENSSFHIVPNRLSIRNWFVSHIIQFAYARDQGEFGFTQLRDDQLVGGPNWIYPGTFSYEGYDIVAKVDDSVAARFGRDCGAAFLRGNCGYRHEMMLMLQSLLADRFKLQVRRETEEGRVYDLVIAKGGPKFLHTKLPVPNFPVPAQRPIAPLPCPAGLACA